MSLPKALYELEYNHGSIYGDEEAAALAEVLRASAPSCGPKVKEFEEAFARIVARYADLRGAEPYVFRGSSPGADRFGVVVLAGTAIVLASTVLIMRYDSQAQG